MIALLTSKHLFYVQVVGVVVTDLYSCHNVTHLHNFRIADTQDPLGMRFRMNGLLRPSNML
jgi:hypothetical protein